MFYVFTLLFLLPFWVVYHVPKSLRPHPKWTYKQALMNPILRTILHFTTAIRMSPVQVLEPGAERDRFVVIKPGEGSLYRGIADDPDIKPATIGAVWYPDPLRDEDKVSKTFIIHFHGGAVSGKTI